jgi:hypothetical protein
VALAQSEEGVAGGQPREGDGQARAGRDADRLAVLPPLPRALLLLGTEGPGLPEALMARARRVAIPMAATLSESTPGAIGIATRRARAISASGRPGPSVPSSPCPGRSSCSAPRAPACPRR